MTYLEERKKLFEEQFEYFIDYFEDEDGKWKRTSTEKKIELLTDAVHLLLFKFKDLLEDHEKWKHIYKNANNY